MQSLSITCRQRSPPCFTCLSWKTTNQHFNNNTSVSFIVLHIFCTLDVKSVQSASCCWLRDNWNDTWATSFIIIFSSPDNQRQSDSAARARFSANQDNTLNLHSPHACCYCLILASVCSCVCVQHGTHRVSGLIVESGILKIHRGAARMSCSFIYRMQCIIQQ